MTRETTILFFGLIVLMVMQSCNPDCDSATSANISIDSGNAILAERENQILLRSSPSNFLDGRQVYIDHPEKGAPSRLEVESFFESALNGLVVTIPEAAANVGTPAVYVDDPDCSSDFILVDPLQIRTQDFFFSSGLFVVPPIPLIIIPTPAVVPPTNITNAWIAPYARSYCIWFVPELDENGNESSQLRPFREGVDAPTPPTPNGTGQGSHEFVVCDGAGRHNSADKNPVSGFIDREANIIEIQIDRTSKNLGVELFTGIFIDPDQLPDSDEWRNGFAGCAAQISDDRRSEFMLLTSQSTGQQLLMIKALNL